MKLLIALFLAVALMPVGAPAQNLTRAVSKMPTPRQMHGAVVLGDYLYVIGGELGAPGDHATWSAGVLSAKIAEDGSLGEWKKNRDLPAARAYISNSTIALNDRVYVGGGASNKERFRTVLMSIPDATGQLSPWIESPPYGKSGMACFPMVSTPGWLHILGGKDGEDAQAGVISGRLAADGTVAEWTPSPNLPTPLWFHCAVALGGRVWVWGGATATDPLNNINKSVYSAPILGDGRLGSWRTETAAPDRPFYTASAATAGPFVVSFAPRYGKEDPSNDIWHARLDETTGLLTDWRRREGALPVRLYVPVAPDYRRGFMYIPGGRIGRTGNNMVERQVFLLTLNQGLRTAEERAANQYTYQVEDQLPADALPGFVSYSAARRAAAAKRQPLVLYFHNPAARPAQEQREALAKADMTALSGRASLAWIDTREWPQMARELGVHRVPAWILYDAAGNETARISGRVEVAQLQSQLGAPQ